MQQQITNQVTVSDALTQPAAGMLEASATDYAPRQTGHIGLMGFIIAATWLIRWGGELSASIAALILMASAAVPMMLYDVLVERTHRGAAAGLLWDRPHVADLRRVGTKLLGLLGTLGLATLAYLLFSEYRKDNYQPAFEILSNALWVLLPAAPFYFWWVDGKQAKPEDGFFQAGQVLLGRWKQVNREVLRQHGLGWLVKGFYLPLMLGFLVGDIHIIQTTQAWTNGFGGFVDWTTNLIYTTDLLFGTIGYALTFRVLNSQIRSTQSTALGWTSAIMCYQPFWNVIDGNYLHYQSVRWSDFLPEAQYPVLHVSWGCAVLLAEAVYAYATVIYGLRFSNLTHRGIIRTGLYRFTKHPAYVAKITSYTLMAVPFVTVGRHPLEALRQCVLLVGVALVYRLRATTEERHLMTDPTYRAYVEEMRVKHARWKKRLGLDRLFGRRGEVPSA